MKLSNESRLRELMKFKQEFNEKLENAYKIYEEKTKSMIKGSKTQNNDKQGDIKNLSQTKYSNHNKSLPEIKNKEKGKTLIFKSPFSEKIEDKSLRIKKRGKSQLQIMADTWKPQYMICNYFDNFKRLKDNYEMTDWERVNHIFFYAKFY